MNCLRVFFPKKPCKDKQKLKTLLNLTVTRLALLRNQRQTRCAHAEADVAQLLLLGHKDRALLRAELVIKERNMLDVLAMVESYCHLLTERAFLLNSQKECAEELREAASGLVFASSRCGDLPELREVRRIFSARFGKEFTIAAAELRNNCGVSGKMVQKFSTKQPSLEMRAKVAKEIAIAKSIKVEVAEPTPDTTEKPNPQRKNQAKTKSELPSTPCDLDELLAGGKLATKAKEKYKDAGSAALAAFESAALAAAAAKTAVELYRSESAGGDSGNPGKLKPNSLMNSFLPSASCCSSVDLGCRISKVSSLRIESEKPWGKEILNEIDESDNDEELMRLASKTLVPVYRAHSFAGDREDDDEEVNEMAIVAVEPSKRSKPYREKMAKWNSLSREGASFSVRTRG